MAQQILIVSFPPELKGVSTIPIKNALMKKYPAYEIGVNDE